jgi:hypothetical protein
LLVDGTHGSGGCPVILDANLVERHAADARWRSSRALPASIEWPVPTKAQLTGADLKLDGITFDARTESRFLQRSLWSSSWRGFLITLRKDLCERVFDIDSVAHCKLCHVDPDNPP